MSIRIVATFILGCLLAWAIISNQTQSQLAFKNNEIGKLKSTINEQAELLTKKNDVIKELNNKCGLDIHTEF